jgi:tRNA A-37 threonylcarbamoyl transferase component Bud32
VGDTPKRVLGGRYELEGKLAEGGMGQVHGGRDLLKNRRVAVKLLQSDVAQDDVARERFRREADVLRAIDHPSLVKLLDADVSGREPFLVFEFVEGRSLDEEAASRPMDVVRALELAQQIASAAAALHAHNIVHRDIKPTNVMVRPDGSVCVLDFGTAKRFGEAEVTLDQLTTEGFVIGTLQYMPPEALFAGAPLAPTYDVWSIGIVLWELLTGRRPFEDVEKKGITAFMDSLRESHAPPVTAARPDAPPRVAALVRALLEREADKRLADGAAVARALEELRADVFAPSEPGVRTLPRGVKRDTPVSTRVPQRSSTRTLVVKTGEVPEAPARPRRGLALALAGLALAAVAGAVAVLAPRGGGSAASAPPLPEAALADARTLAAVARAWHADPATLVKRVREAVPAPGDEVAARAAFRAALEGAGLGARPRAALDALPRHLRAAPPERAGELLAPLFGLELVDHFAEAEEMPRGFRLGVDDMLPPGFRQQAAPLVIDGERRALAMRADGRGSAAALTFSVPDPSAVGTVWLSLSGEALRKLHVVRVRLNDHPLSMGGAETGAATGRELRRGIPPALLVRGENRLEARVLGAPADAPPDPEGLRLVLRIR